MGFALAEECARRGADVVLIAGPVQQKTYHSHITRIDVESAQDMYEASHGAIPLGRCRNTVCSGSGFYPDAVADKKIKREGDELLLHLKPTHDIAAALGKIKNSGTEVNWFCSLKRMMSSAMPRES